MAQKPKARAAHRPSAYDPKYADEIVEFMADGYSATAFAGHIGVSRQTIHNWASANPEFFDALKQAQAKSALWWEGVARHNAMTGEGAPSTIIFGLKNRVADEWRDKREHDHTSSDGSMNAQPTVIKIVAADDSDSDG